jgi:hypothetical protein
MHEHQSYYNKRLGTKGIELCCLDPSRDTHLKAWLLYLLRNLALASTVKPKELNLSQGLAGTLVDKIYIHKAKEAQLSGNIAIEAVKKRKAEDIHDYVRKSVQEKEHHEFNKQLQRKDCYDALHAKVQEIKNSNLPPEK